MRSFNSIVLAGGSMKVISALGVIKYFEEHEKLTNVKHFVGTSAGSILNLFLCLSYTVNEIENFLYSALNDPELIQLDADEILNIFTNYGMNSGDNIVRLAEKILYTKLGIKEINFIDFAKKTGKNFVVCVANLTREREEFFSVDTTPGLSVVTAIRVTCSLPLIFTPISIDGDVYVDGGIYNNFPIEYFETERRRDILGINIVYKDYQNHDNFVNYIKFLIYSVIEKLNRKEITPDIKKNIITLQFQFKNEESWIRGDNLRINVTLEKFKKYLEYGYQEAKINFDSEIKNEKVI